MLAALAAISRQRRNGLAQDVQVWGCAVLSHTVFLLVSLCLAISTFVPSARMQLRLGVDQKCAAPALQLVQRASSVLTNHVAMGSCSKCSLSFWCDVCRGHTLPILAFDQVLRYQHYQYKEVHKSIQPIQLSHPAMCILDHQALCAADVGPIVRFCVPTKVSLAAFKTQSTLIIKVPNMQC